MKGYFCSAATSWPDALVRQWAGKHRLRVLYQMTVTAEYERSERFVMMTGIARRHSPARARARLEGQREGRGTGAVT